MFEKIKEYKEFAAILLLIVGGFLWVESRFAYKVESSKNTEKLEETISKMATKKEINSLRCLMKSYISITRLQSEKQNKQSQIIIAEKRVGIYENTELGNALSPELKLLIDQYIRDLNLMRDDLSKIELSLIHETRKDHQVECSSI